MTRIALIIIVAGLASAATTAAYFANPTSTKEVKSKSDHEQRVRDFFEPAPKRDLHSSQEMKPRW
ncbi:entry exclusion protein TrbK [Sinorhizobium meliloti]|uniref:entry exclusion protein TrbK n=1 Tax=Rhizobium meliloti TaxID=382 RepID=UPI00338FCA6A